MYIVKKTLQLREGKDGDKVIVKASEEPQKLPKAIGDEAVKKGFAEKVADKKAPAKKAPAKKAAHPTDPADAADQGNQTDPDGEGSDSGDPAE